VGGQQAITSLVGVGSVVGAALDKCLLDRAVLELQRHAVFVRCYWVWGSGTYVIAPALSCVGIADSYVSLCCAQYWRTELPVSRTRAPASLELFVLC
jgi:hypothetical protein